MLNLLTLTLNMCAVYVEIPLGELALNFKTEHFSAGRQDCVGVPRLGD